MTLVIFLILSVINYQNGNNIPEISDSAVLSVTVEEQISEAFKKARRKPTAQNLGELGLAYHSSANYNQAVLCFKLAIEKVHPNGSGTIIWVVYLWNWESLKMLLRILTG